MTICSKFPKAFFWLASALLGAMLFLQPLAAMAAFQPGPDNDPNFELDTPSANALDAEGIGGLPGDDWETIYKCVGPGYNAGDCTALGGLNANLIATTGILSDPAPNSIFWKGGSKDINNVSEWWWKDGSVPDKDQILHAGAAAYDVSGELIMYIFADRYSNDGDALLGAWFFQNEVTLNADGTFDGVHKNGDIVWFGEFSGGGVVASLRIAKWNDPALTGYDNTCTNTAPTVPYQIGGTKLCVIAEGPGGSGSGYFATVNNRDETSPWPFTPKQGTAGSFPYNSLMEGGINLTQLLGTTPCFSSFLIESRSSTSESAQLKDFVLGAINTCKIGVKKSCTPTLASDGASINNLFKIEVRNEGFATITSVSLEDDHYPNASHTWTYSDSIPPGPNWTEVASYTASLTSQGMTNEVTAIGHAGSFETAPATASVTCANVPVNPGLLVTKDCDKTQLVVDSSTNRLWVKLFYEGTVCNTGDVQLTNVTATETHNGQTGVLTLSRTTLGPKGASDECASFGGYYYPSLPVGSGITQEYNSTCYVRGVTQTWRDTVDAMATAALGGGTVNAIADTADCPLCPNCEPASTSEFTSPRSQSFQIGDQPVKGKSNKSKSR